MTEVNAGTVRNQQDFNERSRVAAFFGTLQAGFTDFHYLRPIWRKNTERDSLIGVGITGIANGNLKNIDLKQGAKIVKDENERVAKILGINPAARTCTVKPSGTTSCVVGTSSGIHAWHSQWYIRNMQCAVGDDLYTYFMDNHPKLIKNMDYQPGSAVIGIPQKAPSDAILRDQETALKFLKRVDEFNRNWVREGHRTGPNFNNVSATCSIKENEWERVGNWMWEKRDSYNGLSVLPYDGGTYADAPFIEITESEYLTRSRYVRGIDLTKIVEEQDNTTARDSIACGPQGCEII